jgi:hypothetical protein
MTITRTIDFGKSSVGLETEQATTAAEKNPAFFAETEWYAGCVTIR